MQSTTSENPQTKEPAVAGRRPVSPRSILLGLLGVTFICGLTAYNDYVVNNTFFVGNFLPIGLLLFFLVFILVVNAPLRRLWPRVAFSTGELGVAMAMALVSCALPSSGLMRYLPAHLVAPWYFAGINSDYAKVMQKADLPDYLFPSFERVASERSRDPVVKYFWDRVPVEEDTFAAHFSAVPWEAWARPALVWGVFTALVVGAMLCLSVVFRRQWVENERLPYPLANVYLSLIEEPPAGRVFNSLFSSRWFWIAAGGVFSIHSLNALHAYFPRTAPEIPVSYQFGTLFSNPPWNFTDWGFKACAVYFSMVGITYFLQSNVAFSLWFGFIAVQVTKMVYGTYQADFTMGMQRDQNFGSVLVFAVTILFIARHQLVLVVKQMLRKPAADEAHGRYMPYFLAGWGLLLCTVGLVGWLMIAGVTLVPALVIVGMSGMLYLVIARVVAETGLMFVQLVVPVDRPFYFASLSLPEGMATTTTARSFFFSGWISTIFVSDQRESLSGFLPQSLKLADGAAFEADRTWHRAIKFTLCLVLAMALGYIVSGGAMLYTEYSYGATADRKQASPINAYGIDASVKGGVLDPTKDYIAKGGPSETHSRWTHLSVGAGITGALSVLRLRFANWPLHPVGYLLAYTYPLQRIWFSILIGWLMKVVIVKFGGSTMYRNVKPLFLGLIIGEVGASALWLVVSLVLNALGMPYTAINLMPT